MSMNRVMVGMNINAVQAQLEDLAESGQFSNQVKEAAYQARFIIQKVVEMLEIDPSADPAVIVQTLVQNKFLKSA